MQFIINIMLTTEKENGELHRMLKSRGSRFYHNPSPTPSINAWDLARPLTTLTLR